TTIDASQPNARPSSSSSSPALAKSISPDARTSSALPSLSVRTVSRCSSRTEVEAPIQPLSSIPLEAVAALVAGRKRGTERLRRTRFSLLLFEYVWGSSRRTTRDDITVLRDLALESR